MKYLNALAVTVEEITNVRIPILLLIISQQRRTVRMQSQENEKNILKLNQHYGFTMENTIFNSNNQYGFLININHPLIFPLYIRYKKIKKLALHFPISDKDRFEFETTIFKTLEKSKEKQLITACKQ